MKHDMIHPNSPAADLADACRREENPELKMQFWELAHEDVLANQGPCQAGLLAEHMYEFWQQPQALPYVSEGQEIQPSDIATGFFLLAVDCYRQALPLRNPAQREPARLRLLALSTAQAVIETERPPSPSSTGTSSLKPHTPD